MDIILIFGIILFRSVINRTPDKDFCFVTLFLIYVAVLCNWMPAGNITKEDTQFYIRHLFTRWNTLSTENSCVGLDMQRKRHFKKDDQFRHGTTAPSGPGHSHYRGFLITLRHTTVDRTTLEEWSTRRRTSTWQSTTHTRDKHPYPGRIQTRPATGIGNCTFIRLAFPT
jgi:hypothetical protein